MRLFEIETGFDKEQSALIQKYGFEQTPDLLVIMNHLNLIRRECKPFLEAVDYIPFEFAMYRGVKKSEDLIINKEVRLAGRKPLDTKERMHTHINDYFETHYGERFRDSMFVTGSMKEARAYGKPYVIFPKGDYTFLWTPYHKDLYVTTGGFQWSDILDTKEWISDQKEGLDKVLASYTTTDLKKAILYDKEIMIRCTSYYGIRYNSKLVSEPMYTKMYTEYLKALT